MGCFLVCFGASKDGRRRKQRHKVQPRDQRNARYNHVQYTVSSVKGKEEKPISPVLEVRDKPVEQSSLSTPKKVTFDSNVTTYEPFLLNEVTEILPDENQGGIEEEDVAKLSLSRSDNSVTLSSGSYPTNHRYQNCRDSDDEGEGLDYEESDIDDGEQDYSDYEEDSDDGIEGLSTKISTSQVFTEEVDCSMQMGGLPNGEVKSTGLISNARDRSVYVHSVLNPVENISQWKAVKVNGKPPLKHQKENLASNSFGSELSFKESSFCFKSKSDLTNSTKQDIAVDASLSNWLVSSETTTRNQTITPEKSMSQGSNSVRSQDDRPILGALTVEEIRQFSATSSPRRSPGRSPDEMPIIGTVGTYWSNNTRPATDSGSPSSYKGIPNTRSKYREDKTVKWHSTPFETRLEKALDRDAAKAVSTP